MTTEQTPSIRNRALEFSQTKLKKRRILYIPEWEANVSVKGPITVAENHRYHQAATSEDPAGGETIVNLSQVMAAAIIDKLEDEQGRAIFQSQDMSFLLTEVDHELINRLYSFVRGEADLSPKKFRVTAG